MTMYVCTHLATGSKRLIDADNMARAMRYCASTAFVIARATPQLAHDLATAGVKIEDAGAGPEGEA